DYLRQSDRLARLRALAERGSWRGRSEIATLWEAIFPLVAGSPDGYGVILMDTNAERYFSLTNALRAIGPSGLAGLKQILRRTPCRGWLILLHHHLVEYPIRSIGLKERMGVVLVNAPDVLKVIASCQSPVVVLHGHRHRDWIGARGNVVVCSAPSVAFGSKSAKDIRAGMFHVHHFAVNAEGGMTLIASERVTVA